jgi:hypothetical protein
MSTVERTLSVLFEAADAGEYGSRPKGYEYKADALITSLAMGCSKPICVDQGS